MRNKIIIIVVISSVTILLFWMLAYEEGMKNFVGENVKQYPYGSDQELNVRTNGPGCFTGTNMIDTIQAFFDLDSLLDTPENFQGNGNDSISFVFLQNPAEILEIRFMLSGVHVVLFQYKFEQEEWIKIKCDTLMESEQDRIRNRIEGEVFPLINLCKTELPYD